MKNKELIEIGFKSNAKFMTSIWLYIDQSENEACSLEYRGQSNSIIDWDAEIDFSRFRLCVYGASSCPSVPIKIKSLEDIKNMIKMF